MVNHKMGTSTWLRDELKLSIITVTFNSAETIADCLQSVASQTTYAEHIIVDGASTDNTVDIVRKFSPSIKVLSEPDAGIYDAMNKGISLAVGDIVGILNADDFYPNTGILQQVLAVFEDPSIDCCYGDLVYVDSADTKRIVRYWRSGEFQPKLFYRGWMPPHPTFFVRSSLYKRFGSFRLDLGTSADYELMLRFLLKHKRKAAYIPDILVHMLSGGVSNASIRNRLEANRMDRLAWRINDLVPYPWTLFMKPLSKIQQFFNKPT